MIRVYLINYRSLLIHLLSVILLCPISYTISAQNSPNNEYHLVKKFPRNWRFYQNEKLVSWKQIDQMCAHNEEMKKVLNNVYDLRRHQIKLESIVSVSLMYMAITSPRDYKWDENYGVYIGTFALLGIVYNHNQKEMREYLSQIQTFLNQHQK